MRKLSEIVHHTNVFYNSKGYLWITLKDVRPDGRHRVVVRKMYSKYVSNWSLDTVRINNETFQIDSQIDLQPTASHSAPYFSN
ncbi:hypothetical protein PGT2_g00006 [Escherichia phage PGT2]|uniref:Uncharacterized protein n=1 Tax=Escherichia phage PGT2 TaxID=2047782 RepID=A0A2D2W2Q6_9CAUD|nr:hypothetical protein HOS43_gp06 [Escherichia phage PGT2]ATS92424.1 hypothetical protein PGT2_g00006 [Escherichia phage PGT2]